MTNPKCTACGHTSRVGATACEMCDARFDARSAHGDADPFGAPQEPFDEAPGAWPGDESSFRPGAEPGGAYDAHPPFDLNLIPSPPFKGVGDMFSPTLEVYRKNFVLVGILVLVTMLPVALLQYGVLGLMISGTDPMWGGQMFTLKITANVFVWLLSIAGSSLLSGALVYAVVDIQRTGNASAAECLRRALKVAPKVFLVRLLYRLVTIVGYILLIVPGIIFSLMYAVGLPVAVLEGRGPLASLKRSAALTDGYKRLIFLTYFLWALLIIVLSMIVNWSFANSGGLQALPLLLVLSAVNGMLTSSTEVLTVYVYLGLRREHATGFETHTFTPGSTAAVG